MQIAKGFGLGAAQVRSKKEFPAALKAMLEYDGPYLLDVICPYQEHVLPMIPGGKDRQRHYHRVVSELLSSPCRVILKQRFRFSPISACNRCDRRTLLGSAGPALWSFCAKFRTTKSMAGRRLDRCFCGPACGGLLIGGWKPLLRGPDSFSSHH